MTERDAMLRAIWADPHDDTVRLAYADYLDENGLSAEHADLIRQQIGGTFPPVEFAYAPGGGPWQWQPLGVSFDPAAAAQKVFDEILGARPHWWDLPAARLLISRGFPDTLLIPSAWLVRECPKCEGGGSYEGGFGSTSAGTHYYCEVCGDGRTKPGTGRVSGPAVDLFRHPITRVLYTDKEPANLRRKSGGARCSVWFNSGADDTGGDERAWRPPAWLPPELFPMPHEKRRANYRGRADATRAASDRAVAYGRARWLKSQKGGA